MSRSLHREVIEQEVIEALQGKRPVTDGRTGSGRTATSGRGQSGRSGDHQHITITRDPGIRTVTDSYKKRKAEAAGVTLRDRSVSRGRDTTGSGRTATARNMSESSRATGSRSRAAGSSFQAAGGGGSPGGGPGSGPVFFSGLGSVDESKQHIFLIVAVIIAAIIYLR